MSRSNGSVHQVLEASLYEVGKTLTNNSVRTMDPKRQIEINQRVLVELGRKD
jgi:hypothetical protein